MSIATRHFAIAVSLFLCWSFPTPVHADVAADEFSYEIRFLTRACLSKERNSQSGSPQLLKHGYKEKTRRKRIEYSKTLKHKQSSLSRPRVSMNFYPKDPARWCYYGFLSLGPGYPERIMELVANEAAKQGFRRIGVNKRINKFHIMAHEYFTNGTRRISVIVGKANGFFSVGIDTAK